MADGGERGHERGPGVLPAVLHDGDFAGGQLEDHLPRHEGHGRDDPGQVGQPGPGPAPRHGDQPGDGQRDRGDQGGLPGQRGEREQSGGGQGTLAAVGQQAGQKASRGQRLGQVPGQTGGEAEVAGQQQTPQRVPACLLGEDPAQRRDRGQRQHVDRGQHVRHRGVLAGRQQPGQRRVPDPDEPVRAVDADAEHRPLQAGRGQGHPVVELAVVAAVGEHGHPGRQVAGVTVDITDDWHPADAAVQLEHDPQHDFDRRQHGRRSARARRPG